MAIKYIEEYRDPELSKKIINNIKRVSSKKIRLMEVCGTHTMSIFKSGIRTLLPDNISLVSGPGCPVCVTTRSEIDSFIELAKMDEVILTTFGDLARTPGTKSSLQNERANGRDIRIVYSTSDALEIAQKNPGKKIIFLGVGFETTAPTTAASILSAKNMNIGNYFVFSAHKLTFPVLVHLVESGRVQIDGFILPGHVSVITGTKAYLPLVEKYHIPCVVAGFEPADILKSILMLARQIVSGIAKLENGYERAVTFDGNQKAKKIMYDCFETVDAAWRGIGTIPESGLRLRKEFADFDAQKMLDMTVSDSKEPEGCACGEILTGLKTPPECPLYKKVCTPANPIGPCMVSSEGTCAAYYRYHTQ